MRIKGTVLKGTLYERKIINDFVDESPETRFGMRSAGSQAYGKAKVDLILVDMEKKLIFMVQAKNAKKWTDTRKAKHTQILGKLLDGNYQVFAEFR